MMHLGKFHAAVRRLTEEYNGKNVNSIIQSLIQHLDSLGANPGNPDIATTFRSQLDQLRSLLANSSLNKPYPTLAALLNSIDAGQYTGDRLFQKIEDLIAQNGMTPQLAANALRELLNKVAAFYQEISAINTAFSHLDVEWEDLKPGEGEIGISIPEPATGVRLLSDLAATSKSWSKALRPFVELADPDHNPIAVRTISSSDWQFYLTAAPAVLLALSGAVNQINDLLRKLVETRQLIAQLREKGVSEAGTAVVAAEADSMLENGARDLAEKFVDETPPADAGRANELKTEITASLKFIAREMAANVTIEVRYLPPDPPKAEIPQEGDEAADVKRIMDLTATAAQIARNMDLLALDSKAQEILNLPAPDEDPD
jgi:hypothetical protein